MKITSSGAGTKGARLTVSYAGDFDVIAVPMYIQENTSAESTLVTSPFLAVGDADGEGHYVYVSRGGILFNIARVHSATTSNWSGGTSANTNCYYGWPPVLRICRTSGTVYITAGELGSSLFGALATRVPATGDGWFVVTTDVDAATMDVVSLGGLFTSGNAASVYWAFLRRFA